FDRNFFDGEIVFELVKGLSDHFVQLHAIGEFEGRLLRGSPEVLQHIIDFSNLSLDILVILLPKIRIAKAVKIKVLLFEFSRGKVKEGFYGDERIANVMTQARGEQ